MINVTIIIIRRYVIGRKMPKVSSGLKVCNKPHYMCLLKVRRSKKKPPEGWELIEPTLDELDQKMREGWYAV